MARVRSSREDIKKDATENAIIKIDSRTKEPHTMRRIPYLQKWRICSHGEEYQNVVLCRLGFFFQIIMGILWGPELFSGGLAQQRRPSWASGNVTDPEARNLIVRNSCWFVSYEVRIVQRYCFWRELTYDLIPTELEAHLRFLASSSCMIRVSEVFCGTVSFLFSVFFPCYFFPFGFFFFGIFFFGIFFLGFFLM